ncbi:hypothetical protein [Flavobacterium sp.]|uniref:hypothetical protein n=1 Tax=Flavobacterium sp. TaxID=239 RepID=UPI0022C13B4D|nr:hypothetical protein [Flavobacterium sp.]MCZ8228011.1 hypothetical protein [Flavobacterium sp.]
MKKKLFFFTLFLFSIFGWSQKSKQDDFSISINGNRITTISNFTHQFNLIKKSTAKQNPKIIYTLIQFTKVPTVNEKEELKKKGINLISYLSNNAY